MPKTYRKKNKSINKTSKNHKICQISLKPFEQVFSKKLAKQEVKKLRNIETYKKEEFAKELLATFAPKSIKPNDNYYDYINYLWLKNVSLEKQQKYIVQIDDFRLAQDKVYTELNDIIVDYFKTHNNKLAKNLRNYYTSVVKMNPLSYSKKLAQEAVRIVDSYIQDDNPWALLAYFNKDEMISNNAPFVWSLNPDDKDPEIFRCYISPIQFILLDLDVYYDNGKDVAYKEKYRREYFKTVKKIFDTTLGKNDFNPKDCFDVQVDIFNALGCIDITSKEEPIYNKVSKHESMEKYGFDWDELSKQIGFKKTPDFFITSSLNYLKCGSKLLIDNWKTPKW